MKRLDNIRVVLVNTQFAGNIGAVARAMKNMALSQLFLVNPAKLEDRAAYIRAASATDVLNHAVVCGSLKEAIGDCKLVIGTSTRDRGMTLPMLTARECGEKLVREAVNAQVALVFGQESCGMQGADLEQCNFQGYIPANPDYSSLNLAAAVQTFSYEIFQAVAADQAKARSLSFTQHDISRREVSYPDNMTMEYFYQHLQKVLYEIQFIIPQHPGQVMKRVRRLFNRARPDEKELKILRGILSAIQNSTKN